MTIIPLPPAADPVLDAAQRFTNAWRQALQRLGAAGGDVSVLQAEIDALQAALADQITTLNLLSEEVAILAGEIAAGTVEGTALVFQDNTPALQRRITGVQIEALIGLARIDEVLNPPEEVVTLWDTGAGDVFGIGGAALWRVA